MQELKDVDCCLIISKFSLFYFIFKAANARLSFQVKKNAKPIEP